MKTKSIEPLLFTLGIRPNLKGYHYLIYGLNLSLNDSSYIINPYRLLYTATACHFNTNSDAVERAIRTAIKNCWNYGNRELLLKLAGFPLKEKPSNSDFLSILYFHLNRANKNTSIQIPFLPA